MWRVRSSGSAAAGTQCPTATGPTTPTATSKSPRCAAPSKLQWRRTARTAAASCAPCRRSSTIRIQKDCGRCSVCTEPRFNQPPATRLVERAQRHLRSRPIELEVRKMEPDAKGTMRKIPESARTEPGWALARVGDGGWWPAIQRGLDAGHFDDEIVAALADILRKAGTRVAWVTSVPSVRLGRYLHPLGRASRRRARSRVRRFDCPHGGPAASARDGQRGPTGGQRPWSLRDHRDSSARHRRAPRRPAHLRLDACDCRGAVAQGGGTSRSPGRARDPVLSRRLVGG